MLIMWRDYRISNIKFTNKARSVSTWLDLAGITYINLLLGRPSRTEVMKSVRREGY